MEQRLGLLGIQRLQWGQGVRDEPLRPWVFPIEFPLLLNWSSRSDRLASCAQTKHSDRMEHQEVDRRELEAEVHRGGGPGVNARIHPRVEAFLAVE